MAAFQAGAFQMVPNEYSRRGLTLIELLVVISIIGLLVALLLPAVQYSREAARRVECQNHLKQIGLAFLNYHDIHKVLPPGYIGENPDPADGKGWGWGALLLPHIEQQPLFDQLDPTTYTLWQAVSDPQRRPLLLRVISTYLCTSDATGDVAHSFRDLAGFPLPVGPIMGPIPSSTQPTFFFHPPPPSAINVSIAKSNYVGSFGEFWDPSSSLWTNSQLRGNGVLGCNSDVRLADVTDGSSHTFLVGERSWDTHAGVWAGVEQWSECVSHGIPMVLGTVFYPPNDLPQVYHLTCDGRGSAGFGSRHTNGCQFVLCDGSVHFVSDSIESRNSSSVSNLGAYQLLGRRNDARTSSALGS